MELGWFVKTGWNYLRKNHGAGRNIVPFPDDIFLASYPRSGNTWTRFLIGNLIHKDEPVTFANVERKVPDIYVNSQLALQRIPRPRLLKTHENYDPRYNTVIAIVRDPRDVAVSSYHFHIKYRTIGEDYPIASYVDGFLEGKWWPHGSWGQHVMSWITTRYGTPRFLLVRYEDMLEDPARELLRIAGMLGLPTDSQSIARAIEHSSADHMRKLEKVQGKDFRGTKKSRQDKPFVRAANKGSWRAELPAASLEAIEALWSPIMLKLGYQPVAGVSPVKNDMSDWAALMPTLAAPLAAV